MFLIHPKLFFGLILWNTVVFFALVGVVVVMALFRDSLRGCPAEFRRIELG